MDVVLDSAVVKKFSNFFNDDESIFVLVDAVKKVTGNGYSLTAKCMICAVSGTDKKVKGDTSSFSNFTTHLQVAHPQEHQEFKQKKDRLKRIKLEKGQKQLTIGKSVVPGKKILLDKLTVKYIVNGMKPLSTVKDQDFCDLVYGLMEDKETKIKIMTPTNLREKIDVLHLAVVKEVSRKLETVKIICLTADIWTSRSRSFLGVTAHWIEIDFSRESVFLACSRFKGSHTYDKIAEELNRIMKDYKIPRKKVVAVVTDNGSNFVKAFKEFGIEFEDETENAEEADFTDAEDSDENEGNGEPNENLVHVNISEIMDCPTAITLPPHFRCASHTLNLVATKDIGKVLEKGLLHKSMGKCSKLFSLSNKSKSADIIRDICGSNLKRPGDTRWNSLYDAVKCLVVHDDKLDDVCHKLGVPKFSSSELEFLKEYIKVTGPLALALDKLQGEDHVFLGDVLPALNSLIIKLNRLKPELHYTQPYADAIISGIMKRYGKILDLDETPASDLVYATMSHPYFKLRWVPTEKHQTLKDLFVQKCGELYQLDQNKTDNTANETKTVSDDFFEFFEDAPVVSDNNKILVECLTYFDDPVQNDMTILKKYPAVELMFRRFNTCLPSSAPVERLFSIAGLVLTPRRNRLSDQLFEKLVLLKKNKRYQ